jgi:hypothetical protein
MAAAADQRHARQQLVGVAPPVPHARVGAHDPARIVGMGVDGHAAEGAAPLAERGVEVGMRDGDGIQPAEALDEGDGDLVDQRDAVP